MNQLKPSFGPACVLACFLTLFCALSCKGTPAPPLINEPVFSITSITIMQAELINTRLKVCLRVDNSNTFPIDLVSFNYELYGAGRFWAAGKETNVCTVPASGFTEKELYLSMNFIDMGRNLLDQIIALERIRYRFTGTAEITSSVGYFPAYTKHFNLEGESEVKK